MSPDERVDIEALMAEIRRKAEEELLESSTEHSRSQRLRFVLENGRLQMERTIPPGRGLFDQWRAALRRFAFRETLQTLEPVLEKQNAWNRAVASLLQEQSAEIQRLRRILNDLQREQASESPEEEAVEPEEHLPPEGE